MAMHTLADWLNVGAVIWLTGANTVPLRKKAHYGMSAHPHVWLNFLLRSNVYSNMRPCAAALGKRSSNGGSMRTDLQKIEVKSISNLPNSRRTSVSATTCILETARPTLFVSGWFAKMLTAATVVCSTWNSSSSCKCCGCFRLPTISSKTLL
jgi:hypothetical protein